MSFMNFLSQKTYLGEFLRQEVILSKSYLRKCSNWLVPPLIINLSFFKNAIKSEPLEVKGKNFQNFHISVISITGTNFKKIHEVRVTCPGRFNMELLNEAFFSFSNGCYNHCKNFFYPFPNQSGKHIPSSKSCNLLVQTMIEKMESGR